METILALSTGFGLVALAVGLTGLAAGRLDRRILSNRARLGIVAAVGLGLLFLGAAPPTRAKAPAAGFPDPRPPVAVREALQRLEQGPPAADKAAVVFPRQARALQQWEDALLTAYEEAERALAAVPAVLDGLATGGLDRFTAWVHLGRYSQDIKQAHLGLHDLTPPSDLNLEHQRALQAALNDFHHSLANQRAAITALQRHVRTGDSAHLQAARTRLDQGRAQRQQALLRLVHVKAQLGAASSSPAPASATGRPTAR